ncbi:MAG: hypothetical protein JSW68_09170 [Burkholderiales bacterium]|nr:MAG: hypothetical protein JSW68_09170 [Burkholderiales bacterium]
MNKLLFWIVVLGVGFLIWKIVSSRARIDPGDAGARRAGAAGRRGRRDRQRAELMIECAQCGVHVPSAEALEADGRSFCCAEHRDAYRRDR